MTAQVAHGSCPTRSCRGRRFGFAGGDPWTLEAIGRELGITRERVRQLEARALHQLQEHLASAA